MEQLGEYGDIKIALDEGFKACDKGIRSLTEDQYNEIRDSVVKGEFKVNYSFNFSIFNSLNIFVIKIFTYFKLL